MKNHRKKHLILLAAAIMLCLPLFSRPVLADYIPLDFETDGQSKSAVLSRNNNNNYGVGWTGQAGFGDLTKPLTLMLSSGGLPDLQGIVCTNLDAPEANMINYAPDQVRLLGEIYSLNELGKFPPWKDITIQKAVFVPMDINDNNIIVGNVFYEYESNDTLRTGAVPFVAEGPEAVPTLIVGRDENGQILPLPGNGTWLDSAVATGINNDNEITGAVFGLMMDSHENALLIQGFSAGKAAVDDDGALTVDEVSMFNCGGNAVTIPFGISNSGKISGMSASLRYPLQNGTFLMDDNGNYLLTDDDIRIPAGEENLGSLADNLTMMKYVKSLGFVVDITSEEARYTTVDQLQDEELLDIETAGVAEVYGTVIYNILDSDRVLGQTAIDSASGSPAALTTMTELIEQIMAFMGQATEPVRLPNSSAQPRFYMSNPPHYESDLSQGMQYPGSTFSSISDINASGTAQGLYSGTEGDSSFLYIPGVCREDNDGFIDLMGRPACVTADPEKPLYVPVRVQNAPNDVYALGFEVSYDTSFLEFAGFVVEPVNSLPTAMLADWQSGVEDSWQGEELGTGVIRVGAYTSTDPILKGQEGILGYLAFYSTSPEVTNLEIQGLVDDIAAWTASGACLFEATGDCNNDGEVTPADALCAFEKGMEICDTSCGPCWEVPGDVDQDNDTDMYDALCIFEYYLGLPSCLD
ncbi:MAG: cohesin domain-containing protein [Desulfosudaceae bacterium]